MGFDVKAFVAGQPGWLKSYTEQIADGPHSGAELVQIVTKNFSISPRLLLALLEYQIGALSQPVAPGGRYLLGEANASYAGLYMQMIWAANVLNNGYYGWRTGALTGFEHPDGTFERPDPWQTAASVALQYYFSRHSSLETYTTVVGSDGLARTYRNLFGDPWAGNQAFIPASLEQPSLTLPFQVGETWAFTGGPHTGWGSQMPWAAVDFAPGSGASGCVLSSFLARAMAPGVVARSETGVVMLDLDGDGDERTGWVILYLHVATAGRVSVGRTLKTGDPVGYPSCEGGTATGTHVHIARKYNGEWISADGVIPFNLDGWLAHNGAAPYDGTLTRGEKTIIACSCSDAASQLQAGK